MCILWKRDTPLTSHFQGGLWTGEPSLTHEMLLHKAARPSPDDEVHQDPRDLGLLVISVLVKPGNLFKCRIKETLLCFA